MLHITKAQDLTVEKINERKTTGMDNLFIAEDLLDSTMFKIMVERMLIVLIHQRIPEAVSLNKKEARTLCNPSHFNISPWLCDSHLPLIIRCVYAAILRELQPYGYNVSYDDTTIIVNWS